MGNLLHTSKYWYLCSRKELYHLDMCPHISLSQESKCHWDRQGHTFLEGCMLSIQHFGCKFGCRSLYYYPKTSLEGIKECIRYCVRKDLDWLGTLTHISLYCCLHSMFQQFHYKMLSMYDLQDSRKCLLGIPQYTDSGKQKEKD